MLGRHHPAQNEQFCFRHEIPGILSSMLGEYQLIAAEIHHQSYGQKEEQSHNDVENAIAFATRILNIFHILR